MQPHGVVIVNETLDNSSAILLGKRTAWPETIDFEALMPSLDFTVALRVIRGGSDMGQSGQTDNRDRRSAACGLDGFEPGGLPTFSP